MALSFPNFRGIRKSLAPRWLTEGDGELVGYSLDLLKDAFTKRLLLGLLARFPQNDSDGTPAPSDALALIGRDRRVVRGINESPESYSTRLLSWLDDRKTQGNPFTLMDRLAAYTGSGCVFRTVDVNGNWFTRAVDGTRSFVLAQGNWDWDGDPLAAQHWSRFWVIIYPPSSLWVKEQAFASGEKFGAAQHTLGTTATSDQVATMRSIVSDWKPGGTRCVNIIVAFDPASLNPSMGSTDPLPHGKWEHWSRQVAGVQASSRLSTARYWDGTV